MHPCDVLFPEEAAIRLAAQAAGDHDGHLPLKASLWLFNMLYICHDIHMLYNDI